MKLGRLGKELSIILIAGMLSTPILGATERVTDTEVTISTQLEQTHALDGHEKEIQFIRQHGEPVNISIVKDNMKLTVEYILGDTYTVKFLMSVEKLDGVPFKVSDNLHINRIELNIKEEIERQAIIEAIPEDAPLVEHLKVMAQFNKDIEAFIQEDDTVAIEGLTTYLQETQSVRTGTSGASYGMCYTQENTDSKVYFTYEGSYGESIMKDMVMSIDSIIGEEEKSEDLAIDLVSYLNTRQGEVVTTIPNILDEGELDYLERLKQTNEEDYLRLKEELEGEPQRLLAERGLKLRVIEGNDSFVIDNIGFIDGRLHVLMLGEDASRSHLEVYDEAGEWVSTSYQTGRTSILEDGSEKNEEYHVFDIASVEELNQYNFKIRRVEVVEEWKGPWEIHLDMSNRVTSDVIKVDQVIPYTTEDNAHLREVHFGKGSLALVIDQIESEIGNADLTIKIKLKDGTERELDHSSASMHTQDQATLVYSLRDVIGEDIKCIEIGNKIIYEYVIDRVD